MLPNLSRQIKEFIKVNGENPTMASDKKVSGFDKYDIEDAARTLIRAIEIKKKPKLFALAKKEALKQAKLAEAAALEEKVNAKLAQTFGKK